MEHRHKMAVGEDRDISVNGATDGTAVIERPDKSVERVSGPRVVLAPEPHAPWRSPKEPYVQYRNKREHLRINQSRSRPIGTC